LSYSPALLHCSFIADGRETSCSPLNPQRHSEPLRGSRVRRRDLYHTL